jgi:hypothetical protein
VLAAFGATYSGPYLLSKPGINLGAKVGYLFGGISFAALLFVIFFVPELAKRSLEEIDELFERRLWQVYRLVIDVRPYLGLTLSPSICTGPGNSKRPRSKVLPPDRRNSPTWKCLRKASTI